MSIVLASGNAGKIKEIQAILGDRPILSQDRFRVPEAPETACTFVENALIKARNAARHAGLPAIADDSGLQVDALGGAPGVISARYAGPSATDADNNRKLLANLRGMPDARRGARFVCVMAYLRHADDPLPVIAQGLWEGRILHEPVGGHGFGYDPLFWAPEYECSSAELPPELKNAISHRAKALKNLALALAQSGL